MTTYLNLKKRIKRNEGFRNKIYFDKLGYPTIGYGHLIKKEEKFLPYKKYNKKLLCDLFDVDLINAKNNMKKFFKTPQPSHIQEVLIEMIFQLGIKKTLKFKRFIKNINKKKYHLAALEMKQSLWYSQTPKRVDGLIKILLKH